MTNGHGGARPGAGRKRKADEMELHDLLATAWPMVQRKATIERLAEIASSDHKKTVEAAHLLLAYSYGKPIDRKEISGPDGEPLKAYVSVNPDDWDDAIDAAD